MKPKNGTVPIKRHPESGQSLVLCLVMLTVLLSVAALAIDMGNVYYAYSQLTSATQSAALAGGNAIRMFTDAKTAMNTYSGKTPGGPNYHANLNVLQPIGVTPNVGCVDPASYPNYLIGPCIAYGPNNGNAVRVTETAIVSTYFARIFGQPRVNLSATAVAVKSGGTGSPWNVALVVDTTASMSSSDAACNGNSRINCALQGIQTLMKTMTPCPTGAACTSSNAIDTVSLFTFPNISPSSVGADYCGGGKGVSVQPYTFPSSTPTTQGYTAGTTATYQVLGFGNDYQQSPMPSGGPALSANSNIAKASGAGTCRGMQNPGGAGTYYAGVIYAAQAALMKQQSTNPGSQNAMVILSDGDATASKSEMDATANGTGQYPSYYDECQQAITAAAQATALGTRIYTVAYGVSSNQSNTCQSDKKSAANPTGTNVTACQTIQAMGGGANSPYFYSDANSNLSGCTATANNKATSLNNIFSAIGTDLGSARILPGNVTFTARQ